MPTLDTLAGYIATAAPGERYIYYTGVVSDENCREAEPVMALAWRAYASGYFDLFQQRGGRGLRYVLQRRHARANHLDYLIDEPRWGYLATKADRKLYERNLSHV